MRPQQKHSTRVKITASRNSFAALAVRFALKKYLLTRRPAVYLVDKFTKSSVFNNEVQHDRKVNTGNIPRFPLVLDLKNSLSSNRLQGFRKTDNRSHRRSSIVAQHQNLFSLNIRSLSVGSTEHLSVLIFTKYTSDRHKTKLRQQGKKRT